MLKMPFDITKSNAEEIIAHSGIKYDAEEATYLKNQLSRDQIGCCGSWDEKQRRRDNRKKETKDKEEKINLKEKIEVEDFQLRIQMEEMSEAEDNEQGSDDDPEFEGPQKRDTKKKIDVMGEIAITSDRINLSIGQRTKIAASVVNAMNGNIYETNISNTTAWRRSQEVRTETASKIKEDFQCPDKVTVHWDGKTMKLKGNVKSNRVCVYLTGADAEKTMKLLGAQRPHMGWEGQSKWWSWTLS
jgi:hypothetical protein